MSRLFSAARLAGLLLFPLLLCLVQSAVVAAPAALPSVIAAAAPASQAAASEATVTVFNRPVAVLRAVVLGMSPAERAERAQARIAQQLAQPGPHRVQQKALEHGSLIQIDGSGSFYLDSQDGDSLNQQTLAEQGLQIQQALQAAIDDMAAAGNLSALLHGAGLALLATLTYALLVWLVWRARRWMMHKSLRFAHQKMAGMNDLGALLIRRERIHGLIRQLLRLFSWVLLMLLSYEWLGIVLSLFPYTQPWGEHLNGYLRDLFGGFGLAVLQAIPGLAIALLIFALARLATRASGRFFDLVQQRKLSVSWLEADLVSPTRRISSIAIWLFALTMAYPYLPGSGTEAFKGVSVLLGLMISLGASSLVGQAASGLILTYSRVYRKGEFIRIGEHDGTISDLGMFTTRIRNGMGVELTLPNSYVLGNVTKNYSRVVNGQGFVVDTRVSIGYDTPWRQVEAMLVEAALATPGVLSDPAPQVFQTALSDFYPEYLLICHAVPSAPRPRAEVINQLHANIQDVFNKYGVQIMSPHYLADPEQAKLVARQNWYAAPARAAQPPHSEMQQD